MILGACANVELDLQIYLCSVAIFVGVFFDTAVGLTCDWLQYFFFKTRCEIIIYQGSLYEMSSQNDILLGLEGYLLPDCMAIKKQTWISSTAPQDKPAGT